MAHQFCPTIEHGQDLIRAFRRQAHVHPGGAQDRGIFATGRGLRASRLWSPAMYSDRARPRLPSGESAACIRPDCRCSRLGTSHRRNGSRAGPPTGRRRRAGLADAAFCVGLGQVCIDGTLTISPLYSAVVLVQISFIASICSRIFFMRVVKTVPWASISSAFQPPPMPNRKRPPLTWSIEATSFAVWIVSRWMTRQIPWRP